MNPSEIIFYLIVDFYYISHMRVEIMKILYNQDFRIETVSNILYKWFDNTHINKNHVST